jgi:uncharacterized protein (DUF1697 family)
MTSWVALLRAVNVAGRNRVPMRELEAAVSGLGHRDVATYLQSGNVVFRARSGNEEAVRNGLERGLEEAFGREIVALVRSSPDLAQIVSRAPWAGEELDHRTVHVAFLAAVPGPDRIPGLDPDRSPPDTVAVDGRQAYLRYPGGSGRTKLTLDYLERTLGVQGTARNWRTVTALAELARERE